MNKTILIIASTALLVAAGLFRAESATLNDIPAPVHDAFAKWSMEHGRNYSSPSEKTYRLAVFYKNFLRIHAENMTAQGYKLGLNKFSDLTKKEFLTKHTGFRFKPTQRNEVALNQLNQPAGIDWVTNGAVVGIKDQGQCGSCWAFSATVATEAAWKIKGNALTSLSEQQLVDCSGSYGNQGCNGGWMDYAFKYVKDNGQVSEASYPYTAMQGTCQAAGKTKVVPTLSGAGYVDVPANSGQALTNAVTQQVVSVAIDAYGIMSYTSGIFAGTCGTQLNHGVAAVGYGVENGTLFWRVRNSWGTNWGEQGYFRAVRSLATGPGICGIQMASSYPTV